MRISQWGAILLATVVWIAGCDGATEPTGAQPPGVEPPRAEPPSPARIEAATATDLTGTVGTDIAPAPTVRAVDAQGGPVRGVSISFRISFQAGSGGGTITNPSTETDAQGLASVEKWTLGTTAGPYDLTASSAGLAPVVFTARAEPGPVAQIATVSGDGQIAGLGEKLLKPLRVGVADSFGNPIAGAPVTFTVIAGDGSIENSPVVTDSDGLAESGAWTLGPTPGVQQVRAESGSAQVVFSALAYGPPSHLPGTIAFVSDRDGDSEIYAINADGSGLEQLTMNDASDDAPAWSPDGGLIAFVSDRDGRPSIYVMTAGGSHVMRRTDGVQPGGYELAWSPSGSAIAFTTLHDGSLHIATVGNDATVTILTNEWGGVNTQPSWSPDGQQLAFVSDWVAYDFVYDIYTMDADGSRIQRLTQASLQGGDQTPYYLHPSWSPDGSMIAFVYGNEFNGWDARWKVAFMAANGEFIKDIAWAGDTPRMEDFDPGPLTWSPDGRGIAYTFVDCDLILRSGCSRVRSVKYASLDGSQQGTIVENARSPSWRR